MDFKSNNNSGGGGYRYSDDHSFGSMDDFDANNDVNSDDRTDENPFKVSYGSLTTEDNNGDDDEEGNGNNDDQEEDQMGDDNGFNDSNSNGINNMQKKYPVSVPSPPAAAAAAAASRSINNRGDIFDDYDENDGGGDRSSGNGHDQQQQHTLDQMQQQQHHQPSQPQHQQPLQHLQLGSDAPAGWPYGNLASAAAPAAEEAAPAAPIAHEGHSSHAQEHTHDSHGQQHYSNNLLQQLQLQLQHFGQEQQQQYGQYQQQQQHLQVPALPTGHSFTNGVENLLSSVLELSRQQQQQQQQPNFETRCNQEEKHSPPFTNEDTPLSNNRPQQPRDGDQSNKSTSAEQKESEPVIELLDDDSDGDDYDENHSKVNPNGVSSSTAGVKRSRDEQNDMTSSRKSNKAARHDGGQPKSTSENVASARKPFLAGGTGGLRVGEAQQLTRFPWHKPTWQALIPSSREIARVRQQQMDLEYERNSEKSYELSLLNMNEFTISGLPTGFSSRPCKVQGLRKTIKECSKGHGKAVFEVDKEGASDDNPDGGKWRIPLVRVFECLY